MSRPGGLGKGLGSLIPSKNKPPVLDETSPVLAGTEIVHQIPTELIVPNPHQPRSDFDVDGLEELTYSIRQHGILQPLVAMRIGEQYQLIAGERRLRAAKIVGLKTVPVLIRQADEQQQLELALVENIQRRNLNPIEEAVAYQRLMDEFNLTQEQAAQKVGKSRSVVANIVRLLSLPTEIQKGLIGGDISYSTARVIVGLPPEQRLEFYRRVTQQHLTVREATHQAQKVEVKRHVRKNKDPQIVAWEDELRHALSTKVGITKNGHQGRITIEFFSDEEFNAIMHTLRGA